MVKLRDGQSGKRELNRLEGASLGIDLRALQLSGNFHPWESSQFENVRRKESPVAVGAKRVTCPVNLGRG